MRHLVGLLLVVGAAYAATPPQTVVTRVEREPLVLPNATLTEDAGRSHGFGDAIAGNGLPDGWRTTLMEGTVAYTPGTGGTRVTHAGAKGTVLSQSWPAQAGDSFILATTLDPGTAGSHPGSVGIAFLQKGELVGYALHRLEVEGTGTQPAEIRASAPVGTDRVAVRWVWAGDTTTSGTFTLGPLTLTRIRATSRLVSHALQHIFLVTIETFRADHASLHGYGRATTPNLTKLAAEGAVLREHTVQAPYTRPSLSSLVTSRYPVSLGITENLPPLPPEATTVAEMFADKGYVTSAFVAQFLLSAHYGFNQGFHDFYNHANDTPAATVYRDLLPWMDTHTEDNTFTWVHLFDPHGPYRPRTPKFQGDTLWNADTARLTAGTGKLTGPFVPAYVLDAGRLERRHYVASYDSELVEADARIGELVDRIRALGIADRSLVVVTADHGESMTDHGRYFCHGSLYEHDLHVPMVVWAPGRVKPGTQVTDRTTHLDIVPTLLDFAGLRGPAGLKGRSFRGLLDGGGFPTQPYSVAVVGEGDEERVAVRGDGPLKVIVDRVGRVVEAYDLDSDPGELTNLGGTPAATALSAAWKTWMDQELGTDGRAAPTQERTLSEEEEERLRALGYIE